MRLAPSRTVLGKAQRRQTIGSGSTVRVILRTLRGRHVITNAFSEQPDARHQRIVPVSVECISADVDGGKFVVRNDAPGRILVGVQFAFDFEPRGGGRGSDQVHHHFVADQGLATPVLRDGRKQTVLDLVPLAGTRWEVAHRNFQSRFIREFLQLELPQTEAIAIAATGIGRNQQAGRLRVHRVAHAPPPTADALHRKRRRIMVDPHTDPRFVLRHVVDPVRSDSAQFADDEVVHTHLLWLAFGTQLAPAVLERTDQLLFLGVHRDGRFTGPQLLLDRAIQVFKLSVAVWMFAAFQCFLIGLQTVAQVVEQLRHHTMAGLVPLCLERLGQLAHALARPAQRRLRIASTGRLHQPIQVISQSGVDHHHGLASPTRSTDATLADSHFGPLHFADPLLNRRPRHPCCSRHHNLATASNGQRLRRYHQSPYTLVHHTSERLVALPNTSLIHHPATLPFCTTYYVTVPNRQATSAVVGRMPLRSDCLYSQTGVFV